MSFRMRRMHNRGFDVSTHARRHFQVHTKLVERPRMVACVPLHDFLVAFTYHSLPLWRLYFLPSSWADTAQPFVHLSIILRHRAHRQKASKMPTNSDDMHLVGTQPSSRPT